MASIVTNTNINGMNRKQLKKIARDLGIASVHTLDTPAATLLTAIKAK